jgi:hypothetical protein
LRFFIIFCAQRFNRLGADTWIAERLDLRAETTVQNIIIADQLSGVKCSVEAAEVQRSKIQGLDDSW